MGVSRVDEFRSLVKILINLCDSHDEEGHASDSGEQQGLPDYRSPRPNRSPSVHGYGRAKSYAEGTTPRSRRSLTPTGSIKDTSMQPAPPSQSLADNLAGDAMGKWLLGWKLLPWSGHWAESV